MALLPFPDLNNTPEQLSLFIPFVSGLGIESAQYAQYDPLTWNTQPLTGTDTFVSFLAKDSVFLNNLNTSLVQHTTLPADIALNIPFLKAVGFEDGRFALYDPLTWNIQPLTGSDTFLRFLANDIAFFNIINSISFTKNTSWVEKFNFNANSTLQKSIQLMTGLSAIFEGFTTNTTNPGSKAGLPAKTLKAGVQFFTRTATITSANISSANISSANISSANITSAFITNLTSTDGFITSLSTNTLTSLSGQFEWLSSVEITATRLSSNWITAIDASFVNLTGISVSAHNITADNIIVSSLSSTTLTALSANIQNLTSHDIVVDNATVNLDLHVTQDVYARDLFLTGTCHGCPDSGGGSGSSGGSNVVDGLTAEYIEIINHHTDRPALRVTQYGDQPLALFFDITGHPENNFKSIAAGGEEIPGTPGQAFALSLDFNNNLYSWGSNTYGQLTLHDNPVLTPTLTDFQFTQIDSLGSTVVALSADGSVWAWGYNVEGEIGNDSHTNTNDPIKILEGVKYIAAGSNHTAAIKNNGDLYTWGSNLAGQLGAGLGNIALPSRSTPAFVDTGYVKVACGGSHTLAIKADGTLWAWGNNASGQLGNAGNTNQNAPIQIEASSNRIYTSISCGINHSAAIDSNNNLFMWGSNGFRQLGTVTNNDENTGQLIGTFKFVSCGYFHTLAITPAGAIFGWGKNTRSEILAGAGSTVNEPVSIDPTRQYVYCAAGKDSSYGITIDGSTIVWGNNDNHQTGLVGAVISSPSSLRTGEVSGTNVAMIIEGSIEAPGFVGIHTSTPNVELTVQGNISSSKTVFGDISAPTAAIGSLTSTNNRLITTFLSVVTADNININISNINNASITALNFTSATGSHIILDDIKVTSLTSTDIKNSNSIITNTLTATNAKVITLSSHDITTDKLQVSSNIVAVGDINANNITATGDIRGHIVGSITTATAVLTSLTSEDIFAAQHLGVGTTSLSTITNANAQLFVSGNAVITENLTVSGTTTILDTRTIINSALRISNPHTETSLVVSQSGGLPVAEFYYTHAPFETNQIALFIDGYAFHGDVPVDLYRGGYIGVRTKTPNEALTVRGKISASEDIYTMTGSVCSLSAISTTISATQLSADKGWFTELTIPQLNISGDLTVKNLTAINSTIVSALSVGVDISASNDIHIGRNLTVVGNVSANKFIGAISANSAEFVRLTATDSLLTHITGDSLQSLLISSITADTNILHTAELTSNRISAIDLIVNNVTATNIKLNNFLAVSGISANRIDTDLIFASSGNISLSGLTAKDIFTTTLQTSSLTVQLDATVHGSLTVDLDGSFGRDLTITRDASVGNNLSVANDINVTNIVTARRFIGEIIGPTVSIGSSADLISLSAQSAHINDLQTEHISATDINTVHLTALSADIRYMPRVTADAGTITSITATDIFTTHLTALSANINYLDRLSTNVGFISSLTSRIITTDALSTKSVSADGLTVQNISALTINIANTGLDTNLVIKQYGFNNLAEFYYNEGCTFGDSLAPALVIKGFGCHTPAADYQGGFVGIRTDDPSEALTVVGNISTSDSIFVAGSIGVHTRNPGAAIHVTNGDIWTDNLSAKNSLKANVVRTTDVFATTVNATDLDVVNISAVDTTITHDLFVNGTIHGNLQGGFTSTGTSFFDSISTNRITASFIQSDIITAVDIFTPDGNSDQWNMSYHVPVAINMVIDGGGDSITPGTKSFIELPYDMQLLSWSLYADAPSTFFTAVTVLSSDFTQYPAAVPIHSAAPTLAPNTIKNQSSSLPLWNTTLNAGTILTFGICAQSIPGGTANIDATLITLALKCVRL